MKRLILLLPIVWCTWVFGQGGVIGGNGVIGGSGTFGENAAGALTVTKIGTASCAFSASCSVTATSGVSSTFGVVLIGVGASTGPTGTITIADSGSGGSNTYQNDIPVYCINSNCLFYWSGYIGHAISPGGTITISDTNGTSEATYWVAYAISKFASSSWFDKKQTNGPAFGTSWPSGTTSATTNATDVVIAAWDVASTNTLVSYTNSCTALDTNLLLGARYTYTCWYATTVTGTQAVTMTSGTADDPAAAIAAYLQ